MRRCRGLGRREPRPLPTPSKARTTLTEYTYTKEAKSRRPVTESHPMVRGAIRVLESLSGGPLPSVAIFRRGVELGVFREGQYNSLRARLSQHCDLDDARVVRSRGSKIGFQGSRTSWWTLAETGLGVQAIRDNASLLVHRRELSESKRRQIRRARRQRARNLILTDDLLATAPVELRLVAGRTVREALLSSLAADAVEWLLNSLPLTPAFRARLLAAGSAERRSEIINSEERRRA